MAATALYWPAKPSNRVGPSPATAWLPAPVIVESHTLALAQAAVAASSADSTAAAQPSGDTHRPRRTHRESDSYAPVLHVDSAHRSDSNTPVCFSNSWSFAR